MGCGCNMGRRCTDYDRQYLAKDVESCGTLIDELYEQPRLLTCLIEPLDHAAIQQCRGRILFSL